MTDTTDTYGALSRRAGPRRIPSRWGATSAVLSLVLCALAMSVLGTSTGHAQEQPGEAFSLVSVMTGYCITAPLSEGGRPEASMRKCRGRDYPKQRWTYSQETRRLTTAGGCLATAGRGLTASIRVEPCDPDSNNQRWDIDNRGRILLRDAELNRLRLAVAVARGNREQGARLWLTYSHRGENQPFRRDPGGAGGSTVSIESDLSSPNSAAACADAGNREVGTQLFLWACRGPGHASQRFVRTPAMQFKIADTEGSSRELCIDGGSGQETSPVRIEECNGGASQKWNLDATGELTGINGLCLTPGGESNANGSLLSLYSCNGFFPGQRWSFRDPR